MGPPGGSFRTVPSSGVVIRFEKAWTLIDDLQKDPIDDSQKAMLFNLFIKSHA